MIGVGIGVHWSVWAAGGAAPAWTPSDSTPLDVLDVGAAGAAWTTTGKTVAATAPGDPIGALVPQGGPAGDWQQATAGRRMLIAAIGSQVAALCDHSDDAIGRISNYPSAGPKTLGIRAQYVGAIGAAEVDVLLVVGGTTRGFQVRIGGASSTAPGVSFAADVTGPTVSRRCSTWIPTTAPFSLVIVYRGGGNTTTANYSLFIDGVELTIDTTGPSMDVSTTSYVLNAGPTASPVNGKFSRLCVVAEDKTATADEVRTWLEETGALLLESGGFLLLENGGKILLE